MIALTLKTRESIFILLALFHSHFPYASPTGTWVRDDVKNQKAHLQVACFIHESHEYALVQQARIARPRDETLTRCYKAPI